MTMNPSISREDVLDVFAVEPNHDRSTLERYLRDYPQYAVEIAVLSHELSKVVTESKAGISPEDEAWIESAWKKFGLSGVEGHARPCNVDVGDTSCIALDNSTGGNSLDTHLRPASRNQARSESKTLVFVDPLFYAESKDPQAFRLGLQTGHMWCHLWSDDVEALHRVAGLIGMRRAWFQPKHGSFGEFNHYDLTPGKRQQALRNGAVEGSLIEWVRLKVDAYLARPSQLTAAIAQVQQDLGMVYHDHFNAVDRRLVEKAFAGAEADALLRIQQRQGGNI